MKSVLPLLSLAVSEQLIFCNSDQDDACQFAFDTLDGYPNDSCYILDTEKENIVAGKSVFGTLSTYISEHCGMRNIQIGVRKQLAGYGCWCSFGQNLKFGSGPVVDYQDEICRQLNHNYRCMEVDAAVEQKACGYEFKDYMAVLSPVTDERDSIEKCVKIFTFFDTIEPGKYKQEDRPCAIRKCVSDTEFLSKQAQISVDPLGFDEDLKWLEYGGKFDKEQCKQEQGTVGQRDELICCAAYPNRFPIWNSSQIGCCVNKRYNLVSEDCCNDGGVSAVGYC